MDVYEKSLEAHRSWGGKVEVISRAETDCSEALSLAYTPGVAQPCLEIQKKPELSWELTRRHNLVAVISDGSAVLGLGNIGAAAAMPVMEGKCALFKNFADVDAFPICLPTQDTDELVRTIQLLSLSFGGINLEDISAPRCFEIERRLRELCDIPVFHDDQHGTAIVLSAALINALKVVNKRMEDARIVISGAGAAGGAIARQLISLGARHILACSRGGILCRTEEYKNPAHRELAELTNAELMKGSLADALSGADVFIGVSAAGIVSEEMARSMAKDAIIFAMANPTPEIMPELAKAAGAAVVGSGRSDYPNQINNLLAFPGVFRGALDCRATCINEEMKRAAAFALAGLIAPEELSAENIIASPFDKRVVPAVAEAVMRAARETGAARA